MKNSKSALLGASALALIASGLATPTLAQSHYDRGSRTQCANWNFQYRSYAAISRVFNSGYFATLSFHSGAAYGNANCQRF